MTASGEGERGRRRSRPASEDDREPAGAAGVSSLRGEPEPEWADAIRRGRQARADRLRSVFATFDGPTPVDGGAREAPDDDVPGDGASA